MSYSLAEAAQATGLNRSTILRAIKRGAISGVRDDTGALVVERRRLRPALARRAVSQREANGTAFDGTGRSTTRGASTQLRVCFSGGAELWARPE